MKTLRSAALALLVFVPPAFAGGGIDAALAEIEAEAVCADVAFLASDELGGRDTPSPGLRLAALYLRSRLERLGLEPGGEDGTYFDPYGLERRALDPERTGAWIERDGERIELRFGEDYFFFPRATALEVEAPATYVGGGTAEEVEGLDLSGRWAVAHVAEPRRGWRRVRDAAREAGALGVVVTPGPDYEGRPYAELFGGFARMASRGSLGLPSGNGRESQDGMPFLYVGREHGGAILGPDAPELGADLGIVLGERRAPLDGAEVVVENVSGLWPGSDPELSREVIVLSAHYDHVGERDGEIYNGADDNASGSSALLAVAEGLVKLGPLRRSVLFLWVSGEEKGLLGSRAWARDPTLPDGWRAVANLNLDMVGRNEPEKLLVTPTEEHSAHNGLVPLARRLAPLEGFPELGSCDEYWHRSDQQSFSEGLGIPAMFLFADVHEDYHQPTDTAEKIDCDKIARVSRLVLRILDELQEDELLPR